MITGDMTRERRRVEKYRVPIIKLKGQPVDANYAILSAMLKATEDMPIGDPKFWNRPISSQLAHVQMSKQNKDKFQPVVGNKSCPTGCSKKASRRADKPMRHPLTFVLQRRLGKRMEAINKLVKESMVKDGYEFRPSKPKKSKSDRWNLYRVRDPRTGKCLQKEDLARLVAYADSDPGASKPPEFVKVAPGVKPQPKKARKESVATKEKAAGTFLGTPAAAVRKLQKQKELLKKKVNNQLASSNMGVAPDKAITLKGDSFMLPIRVKNLDALDSTAS